MLVDAVRRAGTTAIFAIHGVQIEPIFQACVDLDVALVDVRHEGTAGFAAEAFSRLTGTLGVAAVCPGPGLTNVLTSMTNATLDRNAVIYVVGSTPESTLETNGLQVGIDHVALARPVSKWACKVHSIDQLGRIVAQAIRVATTAPRGPVLLDIPADVLDAPAEPLSAGAPAVSPAAPSADVVDACLDSLATASRPLMLLGGAPSDSARVAFNELLDVTGVPCFADYAAIGVVADDDERYGGTLYQLGRLPVGSAARRGACPRRAVRVRHARAARRWTFVGHDPAPGRQRSGGGRPVRARRRRGDRRPGTDDRCAGGALS